MFKLPSPVFAPDESGLEAAAAAFDVELNPTPPKGARPSPLKTDGPAERLFDRNERDDEGGDDEDDSEEDSEADEEGADDDQDEDGEGDEGEDEEDEEDDEDGEEDDEEGEEGESSKLDLAAVVQVTVDGAPTEVTVEEAINGYIRQETFHQRLNKLAEVREHLTKEAIDIDGIRSRYAERLEALEQQLDAIAPKEPDWEALKAQDPAAAWETKKAWDQYKEQRAAMTAEKEKAAQESASHAARQTALYIAAEKQKMASMNPEWSNAKVMHKDLSSMRRTAKAAGFSDPEIDELYDSRMVLVLKKASRYDRIMAKKPKPAQRQNGAGKPSAAGSGSSSTRTVPKQVNQASKRLRKTGSVHDAAAVFGEIIKRN